MNVFIVLFLSISMNRVNGYGFGFESWLVGWVVLI